MRKNNKIKPKETDKNVISETQGRITRKRRDDPEPSENLHGNEDKQTERISKKSRNESIGSPVNIKVIHGKRIIDRSKEEKLNPSRSYNKNQNSTIRSTSAKGARALNQQDLRMVNRNKTKQHQSRPSGLCTQDDDNPNQLEVEIDGMKLAVDAQEENEFLGDDENPEIDSEEDFEEGQLMDEESEIDEQLNNDQNEDSNHGQQVSQQNVSEGACPAISSAMENPRSYSPDSEIQFNFKVPAELPEGPQDEQEAMEFLEKNPHLGNVFKKLVKQGIQEERREEALKAQHHQGKGKSGEKSTDQNNGRINVTPSRNIRAPQRKELMKLPSDTTLYAPALKKASENKHTDQLMEKISNFVESIRLETVQRGNDGPSTSSSRPPIEEELDDQQQAREFIIEAEKYQANAEAPPKGMVQNLFINNPEVKTDLIPRQDTGDDDDFFHLTCHVDGNLKSKIERGEYVELDKLLPKNRNGKGGDEGRLEWVSKDGMTFLSPAQDKELKVNSVRRWDQAFQVYVAIYCNANPSRATEILQYMYVINQAASAYQWSNVSFYDTTFRHLMA